MVHTKSFLKLPESPVNKVNRTTHEEWRQERGHINNTDQSTRAIFGVHVRKMWQERAARVLLATFQTSFAQLCASRPVSRRIIAARPQQKCRWAPDFENLGSAFWWFQNNYCTAPIMQLGGGTWFRFEGLGFTPGVNAPSPKIKTNHSFPSKSRRCVILSKYERDNGHRANCCQLTDRKPDKSGIIWSNARNPSLF